MSGFWPIFFLLVVLKIPVLGSLGLIWWAGKAPEPEGAAEEDSDGGFKRWNPEPKLPRGPRRGPHTGGGARRHLGAPLAQRRPGFRTDHSPRELPHTAKTPASERGTQVPPPAPAQTR